MKLTPKLQEFYNEIKKCEKEVPPEMILLQALMVISFVASLKRVKIRSANIDNNSHTKLVSMYAIIFAPSGVGKDRTFNRFNPAIKSIIKKAQQTFDQWKDQRLISLQKIAEEKFPDDKVMRRNYLAPKLPKDAFFIFQDGTKAGLAAFRERLAPASVGSLLYKDSEYSEKFLQKQDKNSFDRFMFQVSEGSNEGKANRENDIKAVSDVPMNMLAYSSPLNPKNEKVWDIILENFKLGGARRSHFFTIDKKKLWTPTLQEKKDIQKRKDKVFQEFAKDINISYDAVVSQEHILSYTTEADERVNTYSNEQKLLIDKSPQRTIREQIIALEIGDRWWRGLGLAGAIAFFEHPEEREVTLADMNAALNAIDLLSGELKKVIMPYRNEIYKTLFQYMIDNPKPLSMTILRGLYPELNTTQRELSNIMKDKTLENDMLWWSNKQGYQFIATEGKGTTYEIKRLEESEYITLKEAQHA